LQANLRKGPQTQLSLLNDITLRNFDLLLISEPSLATIDGKVTLHTHHKWTPILPSTQWDPNTNLAAYRTMIWANHNGPGVTPIPVESPDITAAIIKVPDYTILIMSVYIPPRADSHHREDLVARLQIIESTITRAKEQYGPQIELVIAGDFNRWHHLWGGHQATVDHFRRRYEAEPILDFMSEWNLQSLLRRGTITFEGPQGRSTVDLTLASGTLAAQLIQCKIHPVEHGSDHRAIETTFDVNSPHTATQIPRLCLKDVDWDTVCTRLEHLRQEDWSIHDSDDLNRAVGRLLNQVTQTVKDLCTESKPSPYYKRWWTENLTALRREYTGIRNLHSRARKYGIDRPDLEELAKQAKQKFHTAIRDQKKKHWKEFLQDTDNVWKAAKYMSGNGGRMPIPALQNDGETIEDDADKARAFLATFFPPLPPIPEPPVVCPSTGPPLTFQPITHDEVKDAIMNANPKKAAGQDQLTAAIWQNTWPVTGDIIFQIFTESIRLGCVPDQWKIAKIVVLPKPNKVPSLLKSYRPISLLSTLGKALEAVIATRISHLVEEHHLLPENHFGARSRRSCEQALNILVERIHGAWRGQKVLSLVSFDVKGAYNGVACQVLVWRLRQSRIPECIIQWIQSFCSHRWASIIVNSSCSEEMEIPHAGLPQGSPLSPILFLFMNAALTKVEITETEGAIAFVDDYTHWIVGSSAEENTIRLQREVIPRALEWASASGASFEAEKTSLIHFTRSKQRCQLPPMPLWVDQVAVAPRPWVKILGVLMDQRMHFREHVAAAAKKGFRAALGLKRLRGLTPDTARQLFMAVVTPTVDYAASVWCSFTKHGTVAPWIIRSFNPIQRSATQAIIGVYRYAALAIAESEASIETSCIRLRKHIYRHWINCHTLPLTHPFWECRRLASYQTVGTVSPFKRFSNFCSPPLHMETIQPGAAHPWKPRIRQFIEPIGESPENQVTRAATPERSRRRIVIYTHGSLKNGNISIGLVIQVNGTTSDCWSMTVGREDQLNLYYAQLGAIYEAVNYANTIVSNLTIPASTTWTTIVTSTFSALQSLAKPRYQSGQSLIRQITDGILRIAETGMNINLQWLSSDGETPGLQHAIRLSRQATPPENSNLIPRWAKTCLKSARWRITRARLEEQGREEFRQGKHGLFTVSLDSALPGKHTRRLYEGLTRSEASALAQLRTGCSRLNQSLFQIKRSEDDQCPCQEGTESVEHFLFHCKQWDDIRQPMIHAMGGRFGDLSYALGGRSTRLDSEGKPIDGTAEAWIPNREIVKVVLKFVIQTKRLTLEE
jgi:hypothetical protein